MVRSRNAIGWTLAIFAFAVVDGMALQARGALLNSFAETFGVPEGVLGLVTPAGTVGFVLVVVAVGLVAGRLEARPWLMVGVAGTLVGLLLIGLAPTFFVLLGMIAVRSAATGVFRGLDRPVLSHLYPSQRGRIFNLHTMAWAVGATAGPLLVTGVIVITDWRYVYLVLAGLLIPVLALLWRLPPPTGTANERSLTRLDVRTIAQQREVLVMGCALVLIGGIESVFFTWLPFYASQFFEPAMANLTLSVYLAAYVPGRLGFSHLALRWPYVRVVIGAVACIVVLLPVTFGLAGDPAMYVGVFALGLLISGLFPTMLAWGIDQLPEFTGPINATALTAAQVGFFVFPATVGVLAQWRSIEEAIFLQVGLAAILLVVVVLGRRVTR